MSKLAERRARLAALKNGQVFADMVAELSRFYRSSAHYGGSSSIEFLLTEAGELFVNWSTRETATTILKKAVKK